MKKLIYLTISTVIMAGCANGGIFSRKSSTDNYTQSAILSPQAQLASSYRIAISERDALSAHISNLSQQMGMARGSKAKKINKELIKAQADYDAIQRVINTYPMSVTNPSMVGSSKDEVQESDKFKDEMERKYQEKLSTQGNDKVSTADITDPEVKRAYENYQRKGESAYSGDRSDNLEVYFSVQIGTGRSGMASSYREVKEVEQRTTSNGKYVYISGRFASENQAIRHCEMLRLNPKYKSAYVVAYRNESRISLEQARSALR